jgi:hypothetical protein
MAVSWEVDQQQWHQILAERNRLRIELETLTDAQRGCHDGCHAGPAVWCDDPLCRLLFRPRLWS